MYPDLKFATVSEKAQGRRFMYPYTQVVAPVQLRPKVVLDKDIAVAVYLPPHCPYADCWAEAVTAKATPMVTNETMDFMVTTKNLVFEGMLGMSDFGGSCYQQITTYIA